jgi:type II secretory ATPase GspE/PulE/Tfp pilus assembly ATPase PilB-like protein
MLQYSLETSVYVMSFLIKNSLLSLPQEKELITLSKQQNKTPLDILLHLFPDNEEKIREIIANIHKVSQEKPSLKGGTIKKHHNFCIWISPTDKYILCHDPQYVIEYYNYIIPGVRILTKTEYDDIVAQKLENASKEELLSFTLSLKKAKIMSVKELKTSSYSEEEIGEDAVKQLDNIIKKSVDFGSSDIHIEVDSDDKGEVFYLVRYRVDGVLHTEIKSKNMDVHAGLISQIKLKSGLKLDENRLPQDGRMTYSLFGEIYSFRVSLKPVIVYDAKSNGMDSQREKIVIRKMPDVNNLTLNILGHNAYNTELLKESCSLANGFNIITGPTGSGKTTLLYALLRDIDTYQKNVSTIEDPVEAELKHINQSQVHPEIGLTFSKVLRAELRQDPDIIMVGEMRDSETAEIAAEASLTGHLVFSTLHTKNAVSSITRLINMGLPPFIVASALSFCVAQRLVRKLCDHCKIPDPNAKKTIQEKILPSLKRIPSKDVSAFFKDILKNPNIHVASKEGCPKCKHLGYTGRTAVIEVARITEEIERIIMHKNADELLLQEVAEKNGMMTMEQDGIYKVLSGLTSLEELYTILVAEE